ncbi:selenium metabolism-associated LysR family transcriptional regulator [Thermincola ferriacetica]
MNLDFLQTFIKIARYGNLTKVAEELGISQPAITKQLKVLEQEFGAVLLHRGQKQVSLTEAGTVLELYAQQIVNLMDKAKYDISKPHKTVSGKLCIAASTIPGHYILPFVAGEFCQEFPQVQLTLEDGDTDEVIKKVLDKSVHIGAVGDCPGHPQLICQHFFTDRLILIVPASHRWAKEKHISLKEMKKGIFVWREKGSGTRKSIERILAAQDVDADKLKIAMELGSTESVITAVEAGYGVSFVSKWSVQNELQTGRIKEVEVIGFDGTRDLYFVYLKSDIIPRTVETFISFANSVTIKEKLIKYLNRSEIKRIQK